MKKLKALIRCLAIISLAVTAITGQLIAAIVLLVLASLSLGIMIGQKIEN